MIQASRYLFLVFLLVLASCGSEKSAEEHIASAQQYLAEADYNSATIELKTALKMNGNSAQGRWLLGKVYLETEDFPSAEKELLRAQELGWDANDIKPALGQALLAQRQFEQVLDIPHEGLEAPAAAQLLSSKATAELSLGKTSAAEKLIERAVEEDPDSVHVKIAETKMMLSQGDLTGALIILEEAIKQSPDLGEAWSLKGDVLMMQRDPQGALQAFDRSIELSSKAFADHFKRALIHLDRQDYEAAQVDARYLLKTSPQHPTGHYIQGMLYYQSGDYPDAITALSSAEPLSLQFPPILYYLSSTHLIEGNLDQASRFATHFLNMDPDNIDGRKLLAAVLLQQGKLEGVQELLGPVLEQYPEDIEALNLSANALMRRGETDQGIDLLTRIAQLQPDSPEAQVRLGTGLMLAGQSDKVAHHMAAALELNKEFQQAEVLLILNYLHRKEFNKAIEAAKAYSDSNPASPTPHILLGRAFLASGKQKEGIASFEEASLLDPGNLAANHTLAQLALAEEDLAGARQHYQAIIEHHPDSLQALLQLAYLDIREGNPTAMITRLEQAIESHPTAIAPRIFLGRYYLGTGQAEKIASVFASLDEKQRQSPEVLDLQAAAQLSGKDYLKAQNTLEQLITLTPQTASFHHAQAKAAAGLGDKERVKEELRNAVALDPNYLPSLIALAKMAQTEGNANEFQGYVQKLTELAPDTPEVLRLRAAAAFSGGNKAEAVQLSSLAFTTAPNTQSMQDLAAYQFAAGDAEGAHKLMLKWVQEHPEDVSARLTLADYLISNNRAEDAKNQYMEILDIAPDNILALNNLAWHTRMENPSQALEYSRRAAKLAPEDARILDTLAVLEYLNGDNRRAHRNIQRALANAPENLSMLYHRAMIEAALGEKASAVAILEKLLAEGNPDFPERAEAELLLKSL
jgi:putative PEP-CTERM system TPR-repeat lipoprotein